MTPILSATLTPPITTTNGRAGLSSRLAKASSSASSSSPAADGSCCAIPTVDACARCTAPKASCTNRSALAASSAAKPGSLASSRGVEAQVLEHPQLALLVAEGDLAPEQLGQPLRHRPQRQLRLGLPLGPAQVRAHDHLRALVQQQLDGRHGRADAGVVGHVTGVQRHVQVGAHQHAPPGDVQVADAPHVILLMRSTTRQE